MGDVTTRGALDALDRLVVVLENERDQYRDENIALSAELADARRAAQAENTLRLEAERSRDEAAAEAAACLEFLRVELSWGDFHRDMEWKTKHGDNAEKLRAYLAKSGHGLALLTALHEARAERGKAIAQGQADQRAIHDALGWAHGWHGKDLPQPWRGVTVLIAQRDEAQAALGADRVTLLARRYGDESAFDQLRKELDGALATNERLRGLLREAQEVIAQMADGPSHAAWGDMLDRIDAEPAKSGGGEEKRNG